MKGDEKCKNWGGLGFPSHWQYNHSIERIRLPIQLQQKLCIYLVRFQVIESYLSKEDEFNLPHVFGASIGGDPL